MFASCPYCGHQVMADPMLGGQAVDCPGCAGEFVMPMVAGSRLSFDSPIKSLAPIEPIPVAPLAVRKSRPRYDLFHYVVAGSLAAIAAGSVVGFASWNLAGERWFSSIFGYGLPGVIRAGSSASILTGVIVVVLMLATGGSGER